MQIAELIIENANKFYLPYALACDPSDSNLFCSLLIGPCLLDFTRIKSVKDFWSDQNADELMSRYKLSNLPDMSQTKASFLSVSNQSKSKIVNTENVTMNSDFVTKSFESKSNTNSSTTDYYSPFQDVNLTRVNASSSNPKDYVESIHQNLKSKLIYGKNNVLVNQVYCFFFFLINFLTLV
jgi:hypothetical protein